jgi:hypothetical protein
MVIVYVYDEAIDQVAVVTIQDARSEASATSTARDYVQIGRSPSSGPA